jgi:hypothetical protein
MGLFAQRRWDGRVRLWGRLRLGERARRVKIERREPGGTWERAWTRPAGGGREAPSFLVPGDAAFTRATSYVPGAAYRLTIRDEPAGIPVPVVKR